MRFDAYVCPMLKKTVIYLLVFGAYFATACTSDADEPVERESTAIDTWLNRPTGVPEHDPDLQKALLQLEKTLRHAMQVEHIPGLAVAVVKDGRPVWIKTWGVKDIQHPKDSVDVHTRFRLASLSKAFAPALAAQLVREGRLRWEDRVDAHLPDFKPQYPKDATQTLQLRHVLSQASGFPYQAFSNRLNQGESYYFIRPDLNNLGLTHTPGVYFNYQNVVYSLAGEVLEAVTGQCYDSLLQQRILAPLGMTDASSGQQAMLATVNKAMPHAPDEAGRHRIPLYPNYYSASPAAGLNASIADMALWLRALQGYAPDVMDATTLEEMFCIHVPFEPYEPSARQWRPYTAAGYGLGMRVVDVPPHTIVYHGGMVNGYRNEMALCPEQKLGICILTNSFSGMIPHAVTEFFHQYWAKQTKASSGQVSLLGADKAR